MGGWIKTYEPLNIFGADAPEVCAKYGELMNLLDQPDWKRFKRLARREKKLLHMLNQAKLKSVHCAPIYKFGLKSPGTQLRQIS